MPHKTAMVVSGAITAFVLMVVVGLVYGGSQANDAKANVALAAPAQGTAVQTGANGGASAADVATLQAEVRTYKAELEKAYADLQQAYDQIQAINNAQGGRSHGDDEHGRRGLSFGQFLEGSDD